MTIAIYGIAVSFSRTASRQHTFSTPKTEPHTSESQPGGTENPSSSNSRETSLYGKRNEASRYGNKDVQPILAEVDFLGLSHERFSVQAGGLTYQVETSLDIPFQQYLVGKLDKTTARDIGIVVMNPSTGRIYALAGFDKTGMNGNPCFDSRFPAASIFKIVTAVAGVEKCGFRTGSDFTFNGGKYTLYKSQLTDRKSRYSTRISFQDSFAQSVNPVYGKIGANYLGKESLEEYGEGFGFNRAIDFEIPIHELLRAWELKHRFLTSESVFHHTLFRKETRWPGYYYRGDAMKLDDKNWHVLTVSRRDPKTGEYTMEKAPLYHLVGDLEDKDLAKLKAEGHH